MKNWNSKCMVGALIINIPLGVYNNNIIGRINNTVNIEFLAHLG